MKMTILGVVAVVVLVILSYWPARHYVVTTEKGVIVLAKRFITYTDTVVDIRGWSSADFDSHPELKRAMVDQGYRDMLAEVKSDELMASLNEVLEKASAKADEIQAQMMKIVEDWLSDYLEPEPQARNRPE